MNLFLKSCCWSILLPQFIHSLFETSSLNSTRCVSLSLSRWGNHSECVDRTASTCSLLWTAKVKLSSSSSCGDKTMFRYLLFLSSTHTHAHESLFLWVALSWDEIWFWMRQEFFFPWWSHWLYIVMKASIFREKFREKNFKKIIIGNFEKKISIKISLTTTHNIITLLRLKTFICHDIYHFRAKVNFVFSPFFQSTEQLSSKIHLWRIKVLELN